MNGNRTTHYRNLFFVCVIITIVIIVFATFANINILLRIILDIVGLLFIIAGAFFMLGVDQRTDDN
jgi:uncharacterized protein YqhQ